MPHETPEEVKALMIEYGVDEKLAHKILQDKVTFAMQRMDKWINNARRLQKERAEVIYHLLKRLKKDGVKGNQTIIAEIEKHILEICVDGCNNAANTNE